MWGVDFQTDETGTDVSISNEVGGEVLQNFWMIIVHWEIVNANFLIPGPGVSVSFSTRPRQEPSFNEENDWILALLYLKITNPDQDETKTRLSKIEANEKNETV